MVAKEPPRADETVCSRRQAAAGIGGRAAPHVDCSEERRVAARLRDHIPELPSLVVPAGTYLFEEGEQVSELSVIEAGLVSLRHQGSERQVMLAFLRPGDVCGYVPLITGQAAAFDAVAVAETRVTTVPAVQFWALMGRSVEFARWWVAYSACLAAGHQERLLSLLSGDIGARVARLLLHEFASVGSDSIELTQQAIADLLGVRRSSVSRALHVLAQRGVVDGGYAQLQLLDRAGLTMAAAGRLPTNVERRRP